MIVDVNSYLGCWPYWKINVTTGDGLVKLMDRFGVDEAVVASTRSVFYDYAEGNEEVYELVHSFPKRFAGFASVSPLYMDQALSEMKKRVGEQGMKGLRLYPSPHPRYQGYELKDDIAHTLMEEIARLKVPVMIPVRLTLNPAFPGVDVKQILELANRFTEVRFIMGCINSLEATKNSSAIKRHDNISIDTSGLQMLKNIEYLVDEIGVQKILFGTGMPIQYPGPGLTKIRDAKISEEEKRFILGENAAKLLGLE